MIHTNDKTPVDSVNPYIGSIGHLLTATSPTVMLPHSMAQVSPVFTPGIMDHYLADRIYGFPVGACTMMPTVGSLKTMPSDYTSSFDHDKETAAPYHYSVELEDYDIKAEFTVTEHAVYYRFAYPSSSESRILLNNLNDIKILSDTAIEGYGTSRGVKQYIYLEFSKPFKAHTYETESDDSYPANPNVSDDVNQPNILFSADYTTETSESIEVKVGLSYIDTEQARRNLAEIPSWDFEAVKGNAREVWNKALSSIEVKGGTEKQRTIFYTALYRSMTRMVNVTEYGRYYNSFTKKVESTEGYDFYINDGLWDTYRCMHPLQLLLDSKRQVDMIQSYLRIYDSTGWLPTFPFMDGDRCAMIGNHGAAFITDTFVKGYRGFDIDKAYEAMKKNAMECTLLPWRKGPHTKLDKVYLEKGFFPALDRGEEETVEEVHSFERRQSVAVTLEWAYDDWCIAQMARALGKEGEYEYFCARGQNYRNLFDKRTGFMSPKNYNGEWIRDFDPKLDGGLGGRDFTAECNSWIYSFHVQQDIEGLMELMGGRESFAKRLDALFTEQYDVAKYHFLGQFPDSTGLIGQYCQGNEPAFHIPYLYNYAGQPWKTQRMVRQIMDVWYGDGPLGICGDEDGGAMSAWYVFTAMGFYPVCPGKPLYDIGSPIFEEVKLHIDGDAVFTIKAENASARNKYIHSAELNGKKLQSLQFSHEEIVNGGELVLKMGDKPHV